MGVPFIFFIHPPVEWKGPQGPEGGWSHSREGAWLWLILWKTDSQLGIPVLDSYMHNRRICFYCVRPLNLGIVTAVTVALINRSPSCVLLEDGNSHFRLLLMVLLWKAKGSIPSSFCPWNSQGLDSQLDSCS